MKYRVFLVILASVLSVQNAEATETETRTPAAIPPRQVELEIQKVVPVKPADQGVSQETVALAIPTDIKQTNNSTEVQSKIMDHNIQNFIQGKYLKNSEVLQTAQKVQEAMKPSVSFGDTEEGGVQHTVNLEIEALQKLAKLNYTGFVDTNVVYAAEDQAVEVSLTEKLSNTTRLSLEHQSKTDLSIVKFNLDW